MNPLKKLAEEIEARTLIFRTYNPQQSYFRKTTGSFFPLRPPFCLNPYFRSNLPKLGSCSVPVNGFVPVSVDENVLFTPIQVLRANEIPFMRMNPRASLLVLPSLELASEFPVLFTRYVDYNNKIVFRIRMLFS